MVQQDEAKFVNEWLKVYHPKHLTWKRVRFGPIADKEFGRMMEVTLRWIDAVVYDGSNILIIEAKIRRDLKVIAQLENARRLFPETEMFTEFHNKPVKLVALLPFHDRDIEAMAAEKSIQVEVFQPEWLMEKLSK